MQDRDNDDVSRENEDAGRGNGDVGGSPSSAANGNDGAGNGDDNGNGPMDPRALIDHASQRLADVIRPEVERLSSGTSVQLRSRGVANPQAEKLWLSVRHHSELISFPEFADFMEELCTDDAVRTATLRTPRRSVQGCFLPGVDAYGMLRTAAEVFLLMYCGICVPPETGGPSPRGRRGRRRGGRGEAEEPGEAGDEVAAPVADETNGNGVGDLFGSRGAGREYTARELEETLEEFIGSDRNSYIRTIIRRLSPERREVKASPFCAMTIGPGPCLLELIWSYWMEEGMLAQTTNAVALRFQNVRQANGRDPLAEVELDPLRPLSGFLWGYLQDEPHRLSVLRRTYEYSHHYGLTLYGKAVPQLRPADPRSRFLEAFHDLLRQAAVFYREGADHTVSPDPFPLLVALKEVHLILSEGAHNQYRDLPWTARVEMLVQQWLLARPEMRDFLRGRLMVSYPEDWMGAVDAMKRLQGWTDVSVIHFRDLAVYGERILLSIRYIDWTSIGDPNAAADWAIFWRAEMQGYIHAYRMATGVNLSDEMVDVRRVGDSRYQQPSHHLRRRLHEQRKHKQLPA